MRSRIKKETDNRIKDIEGKLFKMSDAEKSDMHITEIKTLVNNYNAQDIEEKNTSKVEIKEGSDHRVET